jgi:LPXTG-motif cell wall-anchored protein
MFGMNVPVPFEEHPNGFWLITGIMLGGSFGMLFYFKRKKWI